MKYLIVGSKGQLGLEFCEALRALNKKVIALSKQELDITNFNKVIETFEDIKPSIVINCSAYNLVDKAEEDYIEAIKINAFGVKNLAIASKKHNSLLIHYSTDYVFDGKKETLYTEEDIPNPLSTYGKSKLIGEVVLKEETDNYLIFRVSWLYGKGTQNFLHKLVIWSKDKEILEVPYDEISVPTSTKTTVSVTLKAIDEGLRGLYHLTNTGHASRYEWAKEFFAMIGKNTIIYPVSKDIFNLPARRPGFSAMGNKKISDLLNVNIPHWKNELESYVREISK